MRATMTVLTEDVFRGVSVDEVIEQIADVVEYRRVARGHWSGIVLLADGLLERHPDMFLCTQDQPICRGSFAFILVLEYLFRCPVFGLPCVRSHSMLRLLLGMEQAPQIDRQEAAGNVCVLSGRRISSCISSRARSQ